MSKFLLYIFKILLFSFMAAFIIQYMADLGLRNIDGSIYTDWNNILDGNLNSDLVVLGSSRGYVSYDPRIIQKKTGLSSYNLSMNAGSYNLQDLKFDAYLAKNTTPKVIIQNIDLTHFGKSHVIPEEFQFLPYLYNKNLVENLSEINTDYFWKYYIPLFKYNNQKSFLIKGFFSLFGKKYSISPTIKGFSPKNSIFQTDEHNLRRLRELQSDSTSISSLRKKLVTTKKFLQKHKTDSIKIFLVWAPEYKERLDIVTSIITPLKKDINEMVSGLPGIYFLDFSDDPLGKKKEYFYDTFHLNEKGAILFSTKLSFEIDRILKN